MTPPPQPPPARARVLVIDDDLLVRSVLGRLLEIDHQVELVANAAEALDKLARGTDYDILLCDLLMPNVTGMDLYATIKERFPRLLDRIVFMTGAAFTSRTEEFLATVSNHCLRKPFDFDELRRLVALSAQQPRDVDADSR